MWTAMSDLCPKLFHECLCDTLELCSIVRQQSFRRPKHLKQLQHVSCHTDCSLVCQWLQPEVSVYKSKIGKKGLPKIFIFVYVYRRWLFQNTMYHIYFNVLILLLWLLHFQFIKLTPELEVWVGVSTCLSHSRLKKMQRERSIAAWVRSIKLWVTLNKNYLFLQLCMVYGHELASSSQATWTYVHGSMEIHV